MEDNNNRILYHFRTRGVGAEGVHSREIIKSFKSKGYRVDVVCPPGINFNEEKSLEISEEKSFWGTLSDYAPQILFEIMEILHNAYSFIRLLILTIRNRYDFIYERYAFWNVAGVMVAKLMKLPILLEVNTIRGLESVRKQKLGSIYGRVENFILNNVSSIFVVSNFLKKELERRGIDAEKIVVVPNGVNYKEFNKEVDGTKVRNQFQLDTCITIGFVGYFVPWHKVEWLIESFKVLLSENIKSKLLLIGRGPLRGEYEVLINQLGINKEDVIFTGPIEHKNIPMYLAAVDICVIPDINKHGSSMKLFEYMAMGKIVIAPKVESITRVVNNEVNGFVFTRGDKRELGRTLLKCAKNFAEIKYIGENAEKTIKENYTWYKNVETILQAAKRC